MARNADHFEAARTQTREEFVRNHPWFFLVGSPRIEPALRPKRTDIFRPIEVRPARLIDVNEATAATKVEPVGGHVDDPLDDSEMMILAVRKVQETFPSMITIGRTHNNDICIPDVNVSRFHAFFRIHDDRVELADAGSGNGTFVGTERLEPKGPGQVVVPGQRVTIALLDFDFVDAGECWDRVHALTA
jgi:hypothetical protein